MAYNQELLDGLFTRVLNEAKPTSETDEKHLSDYMKKLFADGYNASSHEIHQFNNLIVKQATEISRQKQTDLIRVLADYDFVGRREAYVYDIPKKLKARAVWAANGTSVNRQRVDTSGRRTVVPERMQGGFYYEPNSLATGDVEKFRELVNGIADAKLRLIWTRLSSLVTTAITNGSIPAANILSAANVTLQDFRKLGSRLNRYGGQPVFIGDQILIDAIAQQQVSNATYQPSTSNERKNELFENYGVGSIGPVRTVAYVNPFTDDKTASKTELPVNEGFMFAGDVNVKPFKVVEFGELYQETQFHYEIEQVELKFYQWIGVEYVQGEALGYVKDTAVTL